MRCLIAAALLLPLSALADDAAAPAPPPPPPAPTTWAGSLSGGYIRTAGATDTTASNVKGELDYTNLPWANELTGSMATGSTSGTTSAEQYDAADKLKFSFDDVDYAFGKLSYDNNRFNGIAENYAESLGYGRRLLMLEKQTLDAEIGVGDSQQREEGQTQFDNQFIGTAGFKYIYNFTPTSQFTQTLDSEIGTKNTLIHPVSALKLTIVGQLNATLSYDYTYNTTVPDGTPHSTTIESVSLGYTFGKKP